MPHPLRLVIVALSIATVSCATKVAEPSGFLEDTGELRRGEGASEPDYEFRSEPDLPLAAGSRLFIAPVQLRLQEPGEVEPEARGRVPDSFVGALRTELAEAGFSLAPSRDGAEYEVRAVITALEPAVPAINLATSIYPSTRLTSELKQAVVGEQSFTGAASTEMEVRRIADGLRVYAMMDHTTGRKAVRTSGSSWAPVEKLCARWAAELAATLRGE